MPPSPLLSPPLQNYPSLEVFGVHVLSPACVCKEAVLYFFLPGQRLCGRWQVVSVFLFDRD